MYHFMDVGVRGKFNRFFHHGGKNDARPLWLEQWSARNPLDGESLDHSAKAGQLPRLEKTAPRK